MRTTEDHLVAEFFEILDRHDASYERAARGAGFSVNMLFKWKAHTTSPTLRAFVRTLDYLGYKLTIERKIR